MTLTIEGVDVSGEAAVTLLREYFAEMVRRYHRRPAEESETDDAMAEDPSDALCAPDGLFLVANRDAAPVGCVGLRHVGARTAEVTRLYVRAAERGRGVGAALLAELELRAARRGVRTLRLDTRSDLLEARALYARRGYAEVPAFNSGPYAEHWFAKSLS